MKVYVQKQSQPQQKASPHPSPLAQHKILNQAVPMSSHADAEGHKVVPSTFASPHFAHDFSRIPVYSKAPVGLQAKLAVNTPGDVYEQEADRISEQVTGTPESQLKSTCKCGGCSTCRNEQAADERLQAKRVLANDSEETAVPSIVHEVLRSTGQPMGRDTRAFFEPRFGHDFSEVRIHADTQASEAASAVNARAFTIGRDMVYGSGQYRPHSLSGLKLIAHELTHIIQQSRGRLGSRDVVQRKKPSAEVTPDKTTKTLNVTSNIVFYGSQVTDAIVSETTSDIQNVWNAAKGIVTYDGEKYSVVFSITGECKTGLTEAEVAANTDVKQNYIRVELKGWKGHMISEYYMGGNAGLLLVEDIKGAGSTSEGHEYGHGLGLDHPAADTSGNIKVTGQPGIMYPRGSYVDTKYQYDPKASQGAKGGTIKPDTRKVTQQDIQNVVDKLIHGKDGKASLGTTSNFYYKD